LRSNFGDAGAAAGGNPGGGGFGAIPLAEGPTQPSGSFLTADLFDEPEAAAAAAPSEIQDADTSASAASPTTRDAALAAWSDGEPADADELEDEPVDEDVSLWWTDSALAAG
jgi:hypothetical protein